MAQEEGNKEEEKLEFDSAGQALGYISLAQARLLAMQTARETPGDYGGRFSSVSMAFEITESAEDEDYYNITLSFRPQGDFSGRPGREQFFIEKEGAIAHRQVLALPRLGRRFPVIPVAIGLAVAGVVAVIAALAVGGLGRGDDSQAPVEAQVIVPLTDTPEPALPLTDTPRSTPTPTATPVPTPTPRPLVEDHFGVDSGSWIYRGTARLLGDKGYVSLTTTGSNRVGVIWLDSAVTQPFVAEFRYNIGGGTGGDGMVFMFYKNRDYSPGAGGCLGFVPRTGGFSRRCANDDRGYGIEFDGWQNDSDDFAGWPADPSKNHIALIKGTPGNHLKFANGPTTEDSVWHNVRVNVGTNSVNVAVDGRGVLSWRGVIDRRHASIGFAAATGGVTNSHIIDDVTIRLQR